MLVKYTRKIALLRRTRGFFPNSLWLPQAKWPSLIHDQARHAHTSYTKDALKTGIRNVKENIKEGVKKDLSPWRFVKWIGTGLATGAGILYFDFCFAKWYNGRNEKILLNAFEHGSCPEPDVTREWLINREEIAKKLSKILLPIPDHSSYHIVVGNHGTGKTTVVRQCAKNVGEGVIYVDVPPILDKFTDKLANAIGYEFKEYVSTIESWKRKILGHGESAEQPRFFRVLDAFERGARKYKTKNGKPPVLILDNISELGRKNMNMLEDLQDTAKLYADQSSCIIVFVSSEGTVPRMMMKRSSWSRSDREPIVVGDLTNKEAFTYLHEKLGIDEKVTNQLIQLLGGRIRDLKTYGDKIKKKGATFEVVRKIVLGDINHNFHQAQMMEGEDSHVIGKVIIQELLKNEKIHFDAFIKLVNNKQVADEMLQANVFSYNPESKIVTFQSRATEVFVRESPEFLLK